jgi:type IV secretory pathway TraG/TraD family ATPase VirD4
MEPLLLTDKMLTRHCLAVAATGSGKSNFLNLLLKQQLMRGGGVIHIDGKNSDDAVKEFLTLARSHDRWQDVRIINIDNSKMSNTYNPLLRGDPEQLVNRIMLLIDNKGESFFRSQAANGLRAIVGLLSTTGLPFTFEDLRVIMSQEEAIRGLLSSAPKDTREYRDFDLFIQQIMEEDRRTGRRVLSDRKRQFAFGDLLGKISAYCSGQVRDVMNVYNPEVDVLRALRENQLLYVGLPMLMKGESATDFARMFLSDLLTAVGQLQNVPPNERPSPTFLVLMDEFSSYAISTMAPLFEQARSANVCLFPFIQTISSLSDPNKGLSKDFANKIIGNTWNKIIFGLEDAESQEEMSRLAGELIRESRTVSKGEGMSGSELSLFGNRSSSTSISVSEKREAVIPPEEFKSLNPGQAFYLGKTGVYKLRVPEVVLRQDEEGIDFPRFRMPERQGLSLTDKYRTLQS